MVANITFTLSSEYTGHAIYSERLFRSVWNSVFGVILSTNPIKTDDIESRNTSYENDAQHIGVLIVIGSLFSVALMIAFVTIP